VFVVLVCRVFPSQILSTTMSIKTSLFVALAITIGCASASAGQGVLVSQIPYSTSGVDTHQAGMRYDTIKDEVSDPSVPTCILGGDAQEDRIVMLLLRSDHDLALQTDQWVNTYNMPNASALTIHWDFSGAGVHETGIASLDMGKTITITEMGYQNDHLNFTFHGAC
jgi:hypothetical protein